VVFSAAVFCSAAAVVLFFVSAAGLDAPHPASTTVASNAVASHFIFFILVPPDVSITPHSRTSFCNALRMTTCRSFPMGAVWIIVYMTIIFFAT
jgi:hypothetical protein